MAMKKTSWRSASVVLATGLIAYATATAQPVAIVTDVLGTAAYGSAMATVGILTQLDAGVRVRLSPHAHMTLFFYSDGAQFEVGGPGSVVLDTTGVHPADGATVKPLAAGGAPAVQLKSGGLVQGAMVMRNLGLRIMAPDGLVLATQPALVWSDTRREATYDVALIDATGKRVFETTTASRAVPLPPELQLEPGRSYAIEVSARVRGTTVQTARAEFAVAPEALRARARALEPTLDAPVAEHVAYALWLDQNDLHDEARKWWADLAAVRPEQGSLRARAGLP